MPSYISLMDQNYKSKSRYLFFTYISFTVSYHHSYDVVFKYQSIRPMWWATL